MKDIFRGCYDVFENGVEEGQKYAFKMMTERLEESRKLGYIECDLGEEWLKTAWKSIWQVTLKGLKYLKQFEYI